MKNIPARWFLFGLFLPFVGLGQTPEVDSLKQLLIGAKEDTNKVLWMGDIAFYLYNLDPEESFKYGEGALQLARRLGFERGVVNAYYKMSIAKYSLGEYDKAIEFANASMKAAEEMGYDLGIYYCYNILNISYRAKSEAEKALEYGFLSAKFSREHGDTISEAIAYSNIGTIYLDYRDTSSAKKYFLQAIAIFKNANQLSNVAEVLSNLSTVESDTARKFRYIVESIELAEKIGFHSALAYGNHNLGSFLWKQRNQPQAALPKYREALHSANLTKDYYEKTLLNIDIGALFEELDMVDSAYFYLNTGLTLAKEQAMKEQMREAMEYLSIVHSKRGQYKLAFETLNTAREIADSLFQSSLADKLADADARYENSKKEAQLAEQELVIARQHNARNQILIGGLLLLLLVVGVFQYYFYKQRRKKKEADLALEMEHRESERLRELDGMKTRFFTNISHELRTPLTLIISPLEEVLKQLRQVNLRDHLQLAHKNSRQLLNLVNEILDLSKLEVGELEVNKTPVPLEPLLRRIFFSFHSAAEIKGVQLVFDCPIQEDFQTPLDVPKTEKILNNLLSNALKATPKGGTITLQAKPLEPSSPDGVSQLDITVSDTGKGIHPDDLPHIFDRFFQSKKTDAKAEGGTGVGLALSRQFAALLGGSLRVESSLGKGSRFTLSLPVSAALPTFIAEDGLPVPHLANLPEETVEDAPLTATYTPLLLNGNKPRLLIVEDNRDMNAYLVSSLSKYYDCSVALDGEEALAFLHQHPAPDLITSDVMMPNMDGFALREAINQNPAWRRIPFILLTARTLEEDKLKGFQLGVDDYITKPFSLPELEARIHNLLLNKVSRDEWEQEAALSPPESTHPDEQLLLDAERLVLEKLDDISFNVEVMAKKLGYSSRHLSRVLGRLTGLSPVQFILELRLQKARQFLENRQFATVSEVRYEIGIESASYFTKKFTERFGKNPSGYLEG